MLSTEQRADIYRHAAELIAENGTWVAVDCCCEAIAWVTLERQKSDHDDELLRAFAEWFHDNGDVVKGDYWWTDPFNSSEDQEARRLALLFMAEIVERP